MGSEGRFLCTETPSSCIMRGGGDWLDEASLGGQVSYGRRRDSPVGDEVERLLPGGGVGAPVVPNVVGEGDVPTEGAPVGLPDPPHTMLLEVGDSVLGLETGDPVAIGVGLCEALGGIPTVVGGEVLIAGAWVRDTEVELVVAAVGACRTGANTFIPAFSSKLDTETKGGDRHAPLLGPR